MLFQLPLAFPFALEIKQHTITSAEINTTSNAMAPTTLPIITLVPESVEPTL